LVERLVRNEKVSGSNPLCSTSFSGAQTAGFRMDVVALLMMVPVHYLLFHRHTPDTPPVKRAEAEA